MRSRSKVSAKFTKYLLMGVSVLGLCSTTLLLTDPMTSDASNNPSLFNIDYQKARSQGRSIASIEKVEPDTMVDLNCGDEVKSVTTSSPRFRLKGKTCTEESAALATQVMNKSNGYVATVFHRDPQSFTTDYINLNEGENEINVRFDSLHGPVDQKVTVIRR